MKNLSLTLGLAAALATSAAFAQDQKPDQGKAPKPDAEARTPDQPKAPEKPKGDGPKQPEPGGAPDKRAAMEKQRAEIQKLMQAGKQDEARAKMEALAKEMGHQGPGRPGGPGSPNPEAMAQKQAEMQKHHAEIQKLAQEGKHDEARARMEAIKKEMGHQGPGRPGGPGGPNPEAMAQKQAEMQKRQGEFQKHQAEIQKLMQAGKHDEARARMEALRKEFGQQGPGGGPFGGPRSGKPDGQPGPGGPGFGRFAGKRAEIQKMMGDGRGKEIREKIEAFREKMGQKGGEGPGRWGEFRGHRFGGADGRHFGGEEMGKAREEIMRLHREGRHDEARKRIGELREKFMGNRGGHGKEGDHRRGPGGPDAKGPGGPDHKGQHDRRPDGPEAKGPGGPDHKGQHDGRPNGPGPKGPGNPGQPQGGPGKPAGPPAQPQGGQGAQGGISPEVARRFEALEKSVQGLAKQLEAVGAELNRRGGN